MRKSDLVDLALAGKNPFEKSLNSASNTKGNREEHQKELVNVQTPWSSLIGQAEREEIMPLISTTDKRNAIFNNELLDIAFVKAVRILSASTGLEPMSVKRVLLGAWKEDNRARRNVVSSVRFFRDFDESTFTDCEECGEENDPTSESCEKCGAARSF